MNSESIWFMHQPDMRFSKVIRDRGRKESSIWTNHDQSMGFCGGPNFLFSCDCRSISCFKIFSSSQKIRSLTGKYKSCMAPKRPHPLPTTYGGLLPSESNCGSTFIVIGIKMLRWRHFPLSRTIDGWRSSATVHEPDSELFDGFWEETGPPDIQKFPYAHNNINTNFLSFLTTDVVLAAEAPPSILRPPISFCAIWSELVLHKINQPLLWISDLHQSPWSPSPCPLPEVSRT
jgi:hypothetical protein